MAGDVETGEQAIERSAAVRLKPFGTRRVTHVFGTWQLHLTAPAPKQQAKRVAEPEGFEPSIGLYNPITV